MKIFYKNNAPVHLNFVSQVRDANEINKMNKVYVSDNNHADTDINNAYNTYKDCKRDLDLYLGDKWEGWNENAIAYYLADKGYLINERWLDRYYSKSFLKLNAPKLSIEDLKTLHGKIEIYFAYKMAFSTHARNRWQSESRMRDKLSKHWLVPYDYSRDIVAKNMIVFYDYKDNFKEVAIWKFDTEEEMDKVYNILQKRLGQTTEEIIID